MNPSGELPQNVVRKVVTTKRSTTRMERPPTASCGPQRGCARQNLPAEANPAVQRLPPGMSYPGRAQEQMNRRTERPVLSGDATKAAGVRFKENSTNPQRSSQIPTAAQQHQQREQERSQCERYLDLIEAKELSMIQEDLKEFQQARRKLFMDKHFYAVKR